jgi:hypothetical protein
MREALSGKLLDSGTQGVHFIHHARSCTHLRLNRLMWGDNHPTK